MPFNVPEGFLDKLDNKIQEQQDRKQYETEHPGLVSIGDEQQEYFIQHQETLQSLQEEKLGAHQISKRLGSVRNAVQALMPEAYALTDTIRTGKIEDLRKTKFHHSRGAKLASEDNRDVLEFDIAGSDFKQFRAEHKGFHGKGTVKFADDPTTYSIEKPLEEKKESKVRYANKHRIFNWLPGIRTEEKILADNQRIRQENEIIRAKNARVREAFKEQVGTVAEVRLGDKTEIHKHVREKVSMGGKKKRITMAGPLRFGGNSNSGEYSIENLRGYMQKAAEEYLTNTFLTWQDGQPHEVSLVIKGHSRGGVACVEGAMMIKQWIYENYPEYEKFVKFEVTQYDPVPGTGSRSKVNEKFNHLSDETYTVGKDKMRPLGDSAETTVVYSMHSNHNLFFDPQEVLGAKRIILTPFRHDVGLDTNETAKTNIGGERQEELSRPAYTEAETGEVYRSSGLTELQKGVYVVDERNTLVKLNSYEQVESIMASVLQNNTKQATRHQIMLRVARAWFDKAAA
ncbi:MAG: hypothetical protein RR372_06920, partial [Oscillospiraceae bacterium]